MSRRIWIAEGYASDGDMYGRTLQLPIGNMQQRPPMRPGAETDIQRTPISILKSHVGDIASCPCLDVAAPGEDEIESGPRGAACAMP